MKKYIWHFLFLLLLLAVAYVYNYHEIISKRPQSTHKWRQSDCASIALNYAQNGMKFFQPETHNLTSDGGTTSNACTSEIPILYYSVAVLYKTFGYNESIFRLLNTVFFFLGLFYLFRLLKYMLKDGFWAISLSLLFFTSPVLVFYGNNFLSNSSSLAFSIVGWYYFFRFYKEGKQKWFVIATLVFLFAATFKVTALFSLFAIAGVYGLELLNLVKLKGNRKLFEQPIQQFLLLAGAISIILAWVFYARYYNQKHDCTYFSTTIFPIWMFGKAKIIAVFDTIRKVWLAHYFHMSVLLFLLFSFFFIVTHYKRNLKVLNLILALILIQAVAYFLLQFLTFKDHDYYTIDLYILPVVILLSIFITLKEAYNSFFTSLWFRLIFSVFVLFNIYYAQKMNTIRYNGWMNKNGKLSNIYTITPYLRDIGISRKDTIISIPDASHVSLYLMNQKGWTEYWDARLHREDPIPYNADSAGIQQSIDRGARYMVIDGIGQLYEKPYLQHFCTSLKGRYNNVLIFDLRSEEQNFNIRSRKVLETYFCGAEFLASGGKRFLGTPDSIIFNNGETQTTAFALNGSYSCMLQKENPYGFTIKMSNLRFGESFVASVWRKQSNKGSIIASADTYYNNDFKLVEENRGWEKLSMEVFVSKELEGKNLVFYLYNPDEEPVYFDDFDIVRYKSVLQPE